MSNYVPTIGLEVHAELKTVTKMFCSCKNDADEEGVNFLTCPVCLAHPGTLPVINKEAVRHVLTVGVAINGVLADYTEFDRKNYFYPDIPKGYQISQFAFPLVSKGTLHDVAITRIHLEEDTASSQHESSGRTLVNYNRAGVPLMELVTEPVIHSAEQAGAFGRELQLLLRTLDVSDADMEKGHMRLEANISISNTDKLGTKVEVKNINSFKAMEKAIAYELKRQESVLETGGEIIQETRGWDDATQKTVSQRKKEGSADYRYFPDPDLPSLKLSELPEFAEGVLRNALPELPQQLRVRLRKLGLAEVEVEQLTQSPALREFFESVLGANMSTGYVKAATNYILNDLVKITRDKSKRDTDLLNKIDISVEKIQWVIEQVVQGKVSSRVAKDVIAKVATDNIEPKEYVTDNALFQVSDESGLEATVDSIIAANSKAVDEYRSGKEASIEYLVGQGMKVLRGSGNPGVLRDLFKKKLST